MPYSPKAHRFFEMCAHSPQHAKGKCPSKGTSAKLASEGVKGSKPKARRRA